MKRESGLTLLEVLATITIFLIVIGVGFAMFSSLHLFVDISKEKYNSHSDQNITVNTITKELSDPVELYYTSSIDEVELRYKPFSTQTAKSLVFNKAFDTITLYESSSQDVSSFTRGSGLILSENLKGFVLKHHNGLDVSVQGLLEMNQLYELVLTFNRYKPNVNGSSTSSPEEVSIIIKPFLPAN